MNKYHMDDDQSFVKIPIFSSLAASYGGIMTTSGANNEDKDGIIKNLGFEGQNNIPRHPV